RLYLIDIRERLIDPQMCRVFPETKTIKHQHVQALQRIDSDRWNLAEICQVSEIVETISDHRQTTMNHFQRCDLQLVADTKTRAGLNDVSDNFRQTAAIV